MIRAHRLVSEGDAALIARLPHGDRHRRRLVVNTEGGERVLIDLAAATALRHGDRLAMEDGRVLRIEAAEEAVADITAADATLLSRLAWHLGNRHTPTAVMADRLRIQRDHVLEAMVTRLGGTVTHRDAPFDPEVGAYHDGGHHHP